MIVFKHLLTIARRKTFRIVLFLFLPFSAGPECTEGQNQFYPGSKASLETCKVNTGHNGLPGKVVKEITGSCRSHTSYCG
eukprot:s3131_g2.t1